MPIKEKEIRTIKPYHYKRQGKIVKIKKSFERGYWVINLTKGEEKALREGKAKQLFEKKSERAKKMDRSKTAKKVYDKPTEEWVKAMGKSDVKEIDTKETKAEKKEKFQKAKKKHESRSEKAKETDVKGIDTPRPRELPKEQKIVKELEALGGKHWQKYDKNRVYFDNIHLAQKLGYDWSTYKTGNISYAEKDGEKISNSEMRRVLSDLNCKLYYDLDDQKFHYYTAPGTGGIHTEEAIKELKQKIE